MARNTIRDLMPEELIDNLRAQFDDVRERVIRALPQERAKRLRRTRFLWFGGGLAAGAALAYLLDPRLGRTRRSRFADQAAGAGRDALGSVERFGRRMASDVEGRIEAAREGADDYTPPNPATLAHKVESEILGHPDIPKGSIVVDAAGNAVTLRGEVTDPGLRERIATMVHGVPGVDEVVNLLHLPGEPAPNKEAARGAGR